MDDATVWLDYHRDEIRKRDREIASLKEQVLNLKAELWLCQERLNRLINEENT